MVLLVSKGGCIFLALGVVGVVKGVVGELVRHNVAPLLCNISYV
jgi:hypothetical protein